MTPRREPPRRRCPCGSAVRGCARHMQAVGAMGAEVLGLAGRRPLVGGQGTGHGDTGRKGTRAVAHPGATAQGAATAPRVCVVCVLSGP